jgi:hypothetical protein
MMESFELTVVLEIRERVRDLRIGAHDNTWIRFEERMKDEFFDEDT